MVSCNCYLSLIYISQYLGYCSVPFFHKVVCCLKKPERIKKITMIKYVLRELNLVVTTTIWW